MGNYSAATVTGVTQTKLASANEMSSTEQRNFNFFVRHENRSIQTLAVWRR